VEVVAAYPATAELAALKEAVGVAAAPEETAGVALVEVEAVEVAPSLMVLTVGPTAAAAGTFAVVEVAPSQIVGMVALAPVAEVEEEGW
jgi:hypothetical protein